MRYVVLPVSTTRATRSHLIFSQPFLTEPEVAAMQHKLLRISLLLLSLVVLASFAGFVAGGGPQAGLNLLVQQIRTVGARQWLVLVAGSVVGAGAIAPLTERIVHLLPARAAPSAVTGKIV
jgi:TRAP-type C4-dicarboxylate transport system permease small subunit